MVKTYLQTSGIPFTEQEVFEGYFDQHGYLTMYYPSLTNINRLLSVSRKIQKSHKESGRVRISEIVAKTKIEHEVVENVVLLDFQRFLATTLLSAFPKGDARVLDIAGGPTIYQHIAVSLVAKHITHSEFSARARFEVLQWLHDAADSYDWDSYIELMRRLLRTDPEYGNLLQRFILDKRKSISSHSRFIRRMLRASSVSGLKKHIRDVIDDDVVYGDVFHPDILTQEEARSDIKIRKHAMDIVTAHFSVESATDSREKWEDGMRHIMAFVKKGGFLVLTAIRNAEWYYIHTKKLPAVKITEHDLRRLCEEERFNIVEMRVLEDSNQEKCGYDGMILLLAQKNS